MIASDFTFDVLSGGLVAIVSAATHTTVFTTASTVTTIIATAAVGIGHWNRIHTVLARCVQM